MKNKTELLTLLAAIVGLLLGLFMPAFAKYFAFMGKIFLLLLKMLVLPIIVLSLFLAVGRIASIQALKDIGLKTLAYYLCTTALAVLTGMLMANLFIFDQTSPQMELSQEGKESDFVGRIFPSNIFESLANGEILHIVVFSLLFGLAFMRLKDDQKSGVLKAADTLFETSMILIRWVLYLAPLGVLSLVWATVAEFDSSQLGAMWGFFKATALAAGIHSFLTLPLVARFLGKFNAYEYFWKVKEALIISLSTASSAATLPVSTKVVEENGVSEEVSRFVLPLGATLNMDGSALYQALLAMLFVSLSGMDMGLGQQLMLFIFIVLSSAGTAGIPSGGIVMMTMVVGFLGLENADFYLGLYILVDRFWDYPITTVNVWGDLVGAKTVDNFRVRQM